MKRSLDHEMLDPKTPKSVNVRTEAREPEFDPTLGIPVRRAEEAKPQKHRLVTIGDSLTQGFQSGAIFNTDISYPRIIAWELGWDEQFRYPRYPGFGGLPLNLEYLLRRVEATVGAKLNWWESGAALFQLRSTLDEIEDYWERGPGSQVPPSAGILHNLSVYGWDIRDALKRTANFCRGTIRRAKDDWLDQAVQDHAARAALRVLPIAQGGGEWTALDAAEALGKDGGIETLIVMLGANNALPAVVRLRVAWSGPGYDDLEKKRDFTVWDPEHFGSELRLLVERVKKIDAKHVIFATVPHVTIAPIARGVDHKVAAGSRYFPYYTRAWISDKMFDPTDNPRITAAEARATDSAIDQYNDAIVGVVRAARKENKARDWYVLDIAGLLDRLAQRRYADHPEARPDWWTPYPLPPALAELDPVPDSRFFVSSQQGRTQGGLFSLDGVHPTTIGYGIIAQEYIRVMERAGVKFYNGDGKTLRRGPINVDFERLLSLDTLMSDPPASLRGELAGIGWIDDKTGIISRLVPTAL